MRFGPNVARGSDLVITLNDAGPKLGKLRENADAIGIRSLELVHLDRLELQIPSKGSPLGGSNFLSTFQPQRIFNKSNNNSAPEQLMPVKINCSGPFLIDLQKQVASFERDVELVCERVDGNGDQLDCQKLELHFLHSLNNDVATEADAGQPAGGSRQHWGFEPERIVAIGFPVTLRIPSMNASVRGNELEYNLKTRRVRLVDQQGAARILQGKDTHVEALGWTMRWRTKVGWGDYWLRDRVS